MALRVSTTGSTVNVNDLGLVLIHPTVDRDLALEFTSDEIRQSVDLTNAIQAGDLIVDDGTFTIAGTDYDPHTALSQELQLQLDGRFISHAELVAGYKNTPIEPNTFPLSLNSTAASTRNVYVVAARWGTWQIDAGDVVVISGSSAADGTYTVESISDHQNLIVVESIPDSTGGTITIYHPNASGRIGVDDTNFNNVSGIILQDVLESIDSKLNVVTDDDKVKVSDNDTSPGFLEDKIVVGSGLDIEIQNEGGNETLLLTNTISGLRVLDEGIELDNSPNYTLDFVGDGVNVTSSGENSALITISGDDRKVKVTDNDAVPDFIFDKIVVGPGLNLTELNDGGNELLQLAANAGEFGTEFYAVYDPTISTTTSTSWQEKLTLSVSGIEEGSYYLIWSCEVSQIVANLQVDLKLELDHTDVLNETEIHFQTGGIWMIGIGAVVRTLSFGDHLFDLDFHSSQNGKQCSIRKASIILWRVV